ncbi:MAG: TM0106 family RecB-like putative nuclease [Elusimicrobiaceae bacterium]|nr:TM0106 family RecB-like putative nuclease [Elusimicrobiaceae bacterium]
MENIYLFQKLFNTFSAGRTPGKEDLPAGKMYQILEDPFGLWCHFHAPKEEAVEEPNLYESLRGKTDKLVRDHWIYDHCSNPVVISGNDNEKFINTLQAMQDGAEGIIGGTLWDLRSEEGLYGGVNFLLKVNAGQSVFGAYHYKIVQLKRAGEMKEHYALQTTLLNKILTEIQGYDAGEALFIFKAKEQILTCARVMERAKNAATLYHSIRRGETVPEANKPPKGALSPWRIYANKYVFEKHDLVLIPHLNVTMREILRKNNINTYDDIVAAGFEKIKELLSDDTFPDNTPVLTYAHALAFVKNKPVLRAKGKFPPPTKKRNLYFDFEATETFQENNSSFIYLIGVWDKEENRFVPFIAREEKEEEIIFKQFANYVADCGPDVALYHWTEYEVKKMKALCNKYPNIKAELEHLVSVCLDLKIEVEKAFYLPSPSLSLKAAAPALGFNWRQKDCGAMDSMVYFTKWLNEGNEEALKKVLMYNEDDCVAMLKVELALRELQSRGEVLEVSELL